ncbi:MAG: ParB/RepB/Spo0J family partition protein [Clostridiales bacterium]|nr:ParB/RepB/Spo0J family partition protein [Clostridiales bacterium]
MAEFKHGLGRGFNPRGLSALIDTGSDDEKQINRPEGSVVEVDIMKIQPNRTQPRRKFYNESIEELAVSIKEVGIIQPLIVTKIGEFYEIVAGERRYRAARIAGFQKVPVIVREYSELEALQTALIENIQREDLNPVDEAATYKRFNEEFSLSQEDIAKKVGKSRSSVANSMRLLKLDEVVLNMLKEETLTVGHCKALLGIENNEVQRKLAEMIVKECLSVRQTEKLVNKALQNPGEEIENKEEQADKSDIHRYDYFEKQISAIVGSKVKVKDSGKIKKVVFEFYSDDEIDGFLGLIKNAAVTEDNN